MDWKDIGKLVAPIAPVLGTILGGPLGGVAGSLLGGFLGLGGSGSANPIIDADTVGKLIEKGGDAVIAAITSAEQEAAARWGYLTTAIQEDTKQGQAINETMRAEVAAGVSWWHWRHLLGYCVVLWTLAPLPLLTWSLWRADGATVQSVINLATALLPYFTIIAALLGYVAADTTRRVTTAITGEHAPTLVTTAIQAITKKK